MGNGKAITENGSAAPKVQEQERESWTQNCSGNPHDNSKWRMITRIKGLRQIRQAICALSRRSNHHGRLIEFLSQRF